MGGGAGLGQFQLQPAGQPADELDYLAGNHSCPCPKKERPGSLSVLQK